MLSCKHHHYLNTPSFVMLSAPNRKFDFCRSNYGFLTSPLTFTLTHKHTKERKADAWNIWISGWKHQWITCFFTEVYTYDRSVTIHLVLSGRNRRPDSHWLVNEFVLSTCQYQWRHAVNKVTSMSIDTIKSKEIHTYTPWLSLSFAHVQPSAYRILAPLPANLLFTSFSFFFPSSSSW